MVAIHLGTIPLTGYVEGMVKLTGILVRYVNVLMITGLDRKTLNCG